MGSRIGAFFAAHPHLKAFLEKVGKDNIGFLASALAWTLLTSIVPIVVGLTAVSGLILLHHGDAQAVVVSRLSAALRGVLTPHEIDNLVKLSVSHANLLGIIGLLGMLWGGSNVGGTLSTVFQPVFRVRGRPFITEKLIDIVMIFVFAVLVLIIIGVTSATALINQMLVNFPLSGPATWLLGTAISLVLAFALFAVTYTVFPNTEPRFKLDNVWPGSAVAAVLFQILTYIWPLYATFAHFQRYTAVLAALLVLSAWIFFFSLILMVGAEIVAFGAIRQAERHNRPVGPAPDATVPQHTPPYPVDLTVETRPRRHEEETREAEKR